MNKVVIIVILVGVLAIVVGCLVDLGLTVYKNNQLEKNTKFPPWPATCPDYWQTIEDEVKNGQRVVHCKNEFGIGDCKNIAPDNVMKFEGGIWTGARG